MGIAESMRRVLEAVRRSLEEVCTVGGDLLEARDHVQMAEGHLARYLDAGCRNLGAETQTVNAGVAERTSPPQTGGSLSVKQNPRQARVGDMVFYTPFGGEARPAIVMRVGRYGNADLLCVPDDPGLGTLPEPTLLWRPAVRYDASGAPDTWRWR